MWIKTKDIMVDACLFSVERNYFGKTKYVITAASTATSINVGAKIIACFPDKDSANQLLEDMSKALVSGTKVFRIPEKCQANHL